MKRTEEPEVVIPLEDTLGHFWELGQSLEAFSVAIRPPAIEIPLLKRLGDPAFVPIPGMQSLLRPAYQAIGRAAMIAAYVDDSNDESG